MTLYKQVHNDWFHIRGAFGIKILTRPGDVLDTAKPPAQWMDAYQNLQEQGKRGLKPYEDFDSEIRHWTKGRNPLFVVTSHAQIAEDKRLRELAAKAEASVEEEKPKKKTTKKEE